jgi:hypothetical protein
LKALPRNYWRFDTRLHSYGSKSAKGTHPASIFAAPFKVMNISIPKDIYCHYGLKRGTIDMYRAFRLLQEHACNAIWTIETSEIEESMDWLLDHKLCEVSVSRPLPPEKT